MRKYCKILLIWYFFIANNLRTFNVILWIYSLKTYRYEKEVMQFDMD